MVGLLGIRMLQLMNNVWSCSWLPTGRCGFIVDTYCIMYHRVLLLQNGRGKVSFQGLQQYTQKYGGGTLEETDLASIFNDFHPRVCARGSGRGRGTPGCVGQEGDAHTLWGDYTRVYVISLEEFMNPVPSFTPLYCLDQLNVCVPPL
jgi:hypothetical protein